VPPPLRELILNCDRAPSLALGGEMPCLHLGSQAGRRRSFSSTHSDTHTFPRRAGARDRLLHRGLVHTTKGDATASRPTSFLKTAAGALPQRP